MDIKQLAVEMNMPESDVEVFVTCLRIWILNKGLSLDEAIAKHMRVMESLVDFCHNMTTEEKRLFVIDTFFPA